jgi:transposase-like protein
VNRSKSAAFPKLGIFGKTVNTMRLNIHGLIANSKCYQMVRQLRWADGVECPHCHATEVVKNGFDETQSDRQRYLCRMCNRSFDDLTGTVFAGHHQPLSVRPILAKFELTVNTTRLLTKNPHAV